MLAEKLLEAAGAAGAAPTYIEDVFSTYLYTGNGSSQSIANGINLGAGYSGVSGGSAQFVGGSTQYCTVPSNTAFDFGSGNFTIEAMVYPTSSSQFSIAYKGSGSTYAPFGLLVYPGSGVSFYASTGGTTWDINANNNCNVALNAWTHIAVVRNGSSFTVYVNGAPSVAATSASALVSNAQAVGLGACNDGTYAGGVRISNLRIVKGTAVYSAAFTPPSSALTAIAGTSLLCFQGASPFVDNSGNSFSLTQVNTPTSNSSGPFPQTTGSGGMVWIKKRGAGTGDHHLYDTVRGATYQLASDLSNATLTRATGLTAFNADGFSIGAYSEVNGSTDPHVSWTFSKQPKFFTHGTYTGNGSTQAITHDLGSAPGCVIVKNTTTSGSWIVWHRSLSSGYYIQLNGTGAQDNLNAARRFGNNSATVDPTSTTITVGDLINTSGDTWVYYAFAHNAGGFGLSGTDNVISCGSFTTDGSGNATVNLGYEPQWVLYKPTSSASNWQIIDNMRGFSQTSATRLFPNTSGADFTSTGNFLFPTATGFQGNGIFLTSEPYIYIAIRRGPMKVPTDGTKVFAPIARTGTGSVTTVSGVGFAPDFVGSQNRSGDCYAWHDKLRGVGHLRSDNTSATTPSTNEVTSYTNDGVVLGASSYGVINLSATPYINHFLRRAPSFFDEVCYAGNDTARTLNHNLGVAPELMIVKVRNNNTWDWCTYVAPLGATKYLQLNLTTASGNAPTVWNNTAPTASVFSVGTATDVNAAGYNFVAYLFATCAGVSKVGSYTGNGSSQTINCGFTGGARFVLIKRTDSTGDWYVWDTARGVVSGNDPHLSLNTTSAEVTTDDTIDPDSTGFVVNQLSATNVNVSSATYIYLAIA